MPTAVKQRNWSDGHLPSLDERMDKGAVSVLLVDDDPRNLTALEALLEMEDLRLVRADSGEEALRRLLREDFALILLDVHMPGMDGFQTAELIRQRPRSRSIPIIFLTAANRDAEYVARGYSLGAVDYILKPIIPEVLRSKVAVFVELFQKTEQVKRQAERDQLLIGEQAARAEAEKGRERFALLSEASRELFSSLDGKSGLMEVAKLVASNLADLCLIRLLNANSGWDRILAVRPGALLDDLPNMITGGSADGDGEPAPEPSAAEGATVRETASDEDLAALFGQPECPLPLASLAPVSLVTVPLIAGEARFGSLTMAGVAGRRFLENDVRMTEDLGGRVALALENMRLYKAAQDAIRLRDDFVAYASHDLKTPLTIIKAQVQLVRRRVSRGQIDADKIVQAMTLIDSSSSTMLGMVNDMLDLASADMGRRIRLNSGATDLVKLARQLALQRPPQTIAGRTISVESATEQLIGQWDAHRLERVLGNLVGNAIKYSGPGSEIRIIIEGDGEGWAIMKVVDQGMGIAREDLPRIFDKFFRGSNISKNVAGTGIGLTGVKQIVEAHGGSLDVDSEQGAGTTVTVRLPVNG